MTYDSVRVINRSDSPPCPYFSLLPETSLLFKNERGRGERTDNDKYPSLPFPLYLTKLNYQFEIIERYTLFLSVRTGEGNATKLTYAKRHRIYRRSQLPFAIGPNPYRFPSTPPANSPNLETRPRRGNVFASRNGSRGGIAREGETQVRRGERAIAEIRRAYGRSPTPRMLALSGPWGPDREGGCAEKSPSLAGLRRRGGGGAGRMEGHRGAADSGIASTISTSHRLYQYYAYSFPRKTCPTGRNCCVCTDRIRLRTDLFADSNHLSPRPPTEFFPLTATLSNSGYLSYRPMIYSIAHYGRLGDPWMKRISNRSLSRSR